MYFTHTHSHSVIGMHEYHNLPAMLFCIFQPLQHTSRKQTAMPGPKDVCLREVFKTVCMLLKLIKIIEKRKGGMGVGIGKRGWEQADVELEQGKKGLKREKGWEQGKGGGGREKAVEKGKWGVRTGGQRGW